MTLPLAVFVFFFVSSSFFGGARVGKKKDTELSSLPPLPPPRRPRMQLTHPIVLADVAGASVFLVLALYFASQPGVTGVERAQIFAALFSALSVTVAIVISK